jgi:hypothetical protein
VQVLACVFEFQPPHERLAERAKAAGFYRFVADVWRRADPELSVYVEEARAGLPRPSVS